MLTRYASFIEPTERFVGTMLHLAVRPSPLGMNTASLAGVPGNVNGDRFNRAMTFEIGTTDVACWSHYNTYISFSIV